MQGTTVAPGTGSGEAPLLVRFGGKLVLEVLPAALASAIGAFLFAQYQFNHGAASAPASAPAVAVPASAEMLQLVREEHAMISDFLTAQRAAEQHRAVAANAADAQAAAEAKLAADAPPRADLTAAAKPAASRNRMIAAAAAERAAATLPPIVVDGARPNTPTILVARVQGAPQPTVSAAAQPGAVMWPAAPPPAHPSIVAETLAVPGHVVAVTLHAVRAIGSIPSWLGHRFGDAEVGAAPLPSSTAS